MQVERLSLQTVRLEHLLVLRRLVHLQVHEELAALRDHAEQSFAGVVVLLVFLKVLRHLVDAARENRNLYRCGARVLCVILMLLDQCLLLRALQRHGRVGTGRKECAPGLGGEKSPWKRGRCVDCTDRRLECKQIARLLGNSAFFAMPERMSVRLSTHRNEDPVYTRRT